MKTLLTVLWGITALYVYQNLTLLSGSKVDPAWEKAPVKQWRE